jgi:hypothetical protein
MYAVLTPLLPSIYAAFFQEDDNTKMVGKLVRIPTVIVFPAHGLFEIVPWTERSQEGSKKIKGL